MGGGLSIAYLPRDSYDYPMCVVRDCQYKLIWNMAHGLPYPFVSDLWVSATWQQVYQQGPDAMFGIRSVDV